MQKLIKISDQQFYYSTIDQVIESCSQEEDCAIIIDENYLDQFLENGGDVIGTNINQVIIISESVNTALSKLEGVGVFLLAAVSLEDAVRLAVLGEALSKEVVCVSKEESAVTKILNEITD